MTTRRSVLAGLAWLPFGAKLLTLRAQAQTSSQFDFYIGPSGSDSNPGTSSQPWAITAINSKRSVYAGKRVGLLDGTYNVSSLGAVSASMDLKLFVASGSDSSHPTVIQAVNPQKAILTAKQGGSYYGTPIIGSGVNGVGTNPQCQYITIKDLVITGSSATAISFAADSGPKTCPGLVIDSCHIYDIVNLTAGAANQGGIVLGTGPQGCIIQNCLIHDCYQPGIARNVHGNSAAVYDWGNDTIIQHCTMHDCNNLIYQKNQGVNPPPQGCTIRNNYFWYGSSGTAVALAGFNNAYGTSPPYQATTVYNNVFENVWIYSNENGGIDALQADMNFYNNTVYASGAGNLGCWISSNAALVHPSIYNNILVRGQMDTARGDLTLGPSYGSWRVCDYNCYPTSPKFGISSLFSRYPSTLISLASWRAVAGNPDTHSLNGDPAFVGPISAGSGPQQYKLAGGSRCIGAGRSGGTASGAAIDMGAWGGTSSIGSNFSPVVVPDPPTLTGVS